MFLLPLALMALTGAPSAETPDNLPPTPPPVRIKVEIINITLTPKDIASLGDDDDVRKSARNRFQAITGYVISHRLLRNVKFLGEGILKGSTPLVVNGEEFSKPRVLGHHIYLTLRDAAAEDRISNISNPPHYLSEISADSGGVAIDKFSTVYSKNSKLAFKVTSLTYARLTLLPPGKE